MRLEKHIQQQTQAALFISPATFVPLFKVHPSLVCDSSPQSVVQLQMMILNLRSMDYRTSSPRLQEPRCQVPLKLNVYVKCVSLQCEKADKR